MSIGALELLGVLLAGTLAAAMHALVALAWRGRDGGAPAAIWLVYALPACAFVAALLTPPDLLSFVAVTVLLTVVVVPLEVVCWLLATRRS